MSLWPQMAVPRLSIASTPTPSSDTKGIDPGGSKVERNVEMIASSMLLRRFGRSFVLLLRHHLCIFLAESCTYTFRVLEELLNAIRNARVLFRAERLGSEIIAARLEASFNETCVELEKILHLLLLDDAGHGLLLRRREVREIHGCQSIKAT